MSQNPHISNALAVDARGLAQLKQQAKADPGKAIGAVSKQFEVVFLNMIMKSMRDATPQTGMFDNDQTRLYTSMLDQQLAQHVAARGTGLAQVMAKQLSRTASTAVAQDQVMSALQPEAASAGRPTDLTAPAVDPALLSRMRELMNRPATGAARDPTTILDRTPQPAAPAPAREAAAPSGLPLSFAKTREFVNRIWQHAADAARDTGIRAHFMVGQAALETGWGRHEIRAADGSPTHNLFNIKAGRGWTGPVAEKVTTEYVNGVAQKSVEKFRVYSSYAEGFRDYASLMRDNPRYAGVLQQAQDAAGFARGLQKAGYATDPAYADKLLRVINGATLRQSLAGGSPQVNA